MQKAKIIDDIFLQLTQSSPSDDSEIEKDQIAFQLQYELNNLIKQEISAEKAAGRQIPPIYITIEDCNVINVEDLECTADCKDRVYIDITGEVVDLQKDAGLVRIITDEGDVVLPASVESLDVINNLRFAKASRTNPIYYRQAKRIFIEGVGEAEVDLSKVTVYYVNKQDILALEDTDEVIMTDQIKPLVIDAVLKRMKLEIYGSEADTDSDSVDVKQARYHNIIANPATLDNQQPQQ